jgi:Primase zinc finger
MLAVTPSSAKSVIIIGKAADYAICEAVKYDGDKCGDFVDARRKTSRKGAEWTPVCEYHQSLAIDKSKKNRPEFGPGASVAGKGKGKGSEFGKNAKWEKGEKKSGRRDIPYAWTAEDGVSGTGSGKRYTTGGCDNMDENDESNVNYDINANLGRSKQEKEQMARKRKREELIIAELDTAPVPSRSIETNAKLKAMKLQADTRSDDKHLWRGAPRSTNSAILLMQQAEKALKARQEKAQKAKSGRRGRSSVDDRSIALDDDDDSNEESDDMRPGGSVREPQYRYSADAVKKMGFNPLAGSYKDRNEDEDDDLRSRLLARSKATHADLPEPQLRTKGQPKWRNVRPPPGATLTSEQQAYDETYGLDLGDLSDYGLSD